MLRWLIYRNQDENLEEKLFTRKEKGFTGRLLTTIKAYFLILVASPFAVFLLPMWYVYCWTERRQGRPNPPSPLTPLFRKQEFRWLYREEEPTPPPKATLETQPETRPPASRKRGTAVVTGGAKRLGALICQELASLGYDVAVVYHNSLPEAVELVEQLQAKGIKAAPFTVQLRHPQEMENLLQEVRSTLGDITLLVNNAAVFSPTHLQDGSYEAMEHLLRVNLLAPLWLTTLAQRQMAPGGLIINMADIWGERPLRGHAAYSASKAGLIMATRAMARELAPRLRINAIAPGAILPSSQDETEFNQMVQRTPLGQQADPQAITKAVRYLVEADYVTGEVLHVDGGRLWS
ncbi:MAG: SDR family oxidoreductase [Magnetococcales bacterium]|nr:SDR family oxidoreductase [Magnetococcales bacterium]NGZ29393.1 SDR family oxidoreductase [Magnetococcales bacterium]